MGGYITKSDEEFIHKEDKCPSNCPANKAAVCSFYDGASLGICQGHRDVGDRFFDFEQYGPGSIVHHAQYNALCEALKKELDERRKHIWYITKLSNFRGSMVDPGDLIHHDQENDINEYVVKLNTWINRFRDRTTYKDGDVKSHEVSRGDIISAENLKYLEENVQAAYQDCICYADCTMHGLSSWTARVWCGSHGASYGGY